MVVAMVRQTTVCPISCSNQSGTACFTKPRQNAISIPAFRSNSYFLIHLNPCPAELLQLYFSSFEAGIASAISSFK